MYESILTSILTCSLVFSLLSALIGITLKLFKKHIPPKMNYYFWLIPFLPLFVPFFPFQLIERWSMQLSTLLPSAAISLTTTSTAQPSTPLLQDVSLSVTRMPKELLLLLFFIWILGCIVFFIPLIHSIIRMQQLKNSSSRIVDTELLQLLNSVKERCNIRHKFYLYASDQIASPTTFGHFRTYVILPTKKIQTLSERELYYILLHELQHYKTRDYLINYVLFLAQLFYWFHPVVWFVRKEIGIQREISCDMNVLTRLSEAELMEYGHTLLNFIDSKTSHKRFAITMELGGSKQQVKQRIHRIATFQKTTKRQLRKSMVLLLTLLCVTFLCFPMIAASAQDSTYDFKTNSSVIYSDYTELFQDFEGTFVLYDTGADQYTIHNKRFSQKRVSPNSTYKIYSSLMGLETGIISIEQSEMAWDGTEYPYDTWNRNHNLASAIHDSVTWYYQNLDRQLGYATIQSYLSKMEYGNCNLYAPLDAYWLESSLKISAIEQVNLLQDFYYNTFQFSEENINYVKHALQVSTKGNSTLSGKTGTGIVNHRTINGWFVGYVETQDNTYFFATNIQGADHAAGSKAYEITLSILQELNIY